MNPLHDRSRNAQGFLTAFSDSMVVNAKDKDAGNVTDHATDGIVPQVPHFPDFFDRIVAFVRDAIDWR